MTAGIPGTGIGGMFYLISALLMPVHEFSIFLFRRRRSSKKRWRTAFKQAGNALGVIIGIWITGWILLHLIIHPVAKSNLGTLNNGNISNIIQIGAVYFSLINLAFVIFGVNILGFIINCKKPKRNPSLRSYKI